MFSPRSPIYRGAWANLERALVGTVLLFFISCGPPPRFDRTPEDHELARLRAWMQTAPVRGWSGSGRARVESADGDVEGKLTFVLDPPERARVEVRASALFGMVGERVVVSIPGDAHVLIYRQRSDVLERIAFRESGLAQLTLNGAPRDLFELVRGRPPWPGGSPPRHWADRARLVERADGGRSLGFRIELDDAHGAFVLRLRDGVLERLEFWTGPTRRLQIDYDRWTRLGDRTQPMQIRVQAPQLDVKAEFEIDSLTPVEDFSERDFEVY